MFLREKTRPTPSSTNFLKIKKKKKNRIRYIKIINGSVQASKFFYSIDKPVIFICRYIYSSG